MISQAEVRSKLKSLISGALSLDEFEDWIAAESWNMHLGADLIAQSLVSAVELRLAEHSSGHLPLERMMDEFRSLTNGLFVIDVRINADPMPLRTGSTVSVERKQIQGLPADRSLLTVYG